MLAQDAAFAASAVLGALILGRALRRTLDELSRGFEVPRAALVLRRPHYKPRWRFPFRTLRTVSLWAVLIMSTTRGLSACIPALRRGPVVIDCTYAGSARTRLSCAAAETATRVLLERVRR